MPSTLAANAPRMLSVLRIVTALIFLLHGSQKLLGIPPSENMPAFLSFMWIGGLLELAGGLLLLVGLFTRATAFVVSGEMAVAFALFGVGAYAPPSWRRDGVAALLAAAVPGGLWLISALDVGKVSDVYVTQYLYLCGVACAGVLPGFALSSRRREVDELEHEVEALCASAATEIGVAVDAERRALGRDLVRVVEALLEEMGRLATRARTGAELPERFGREMADAAGRAAEELRALLHTLTPAESSSEMAVPPGAPRWTSPAQLRAAGGLVLPVLLLAALSVVDAAPAATHTQRFTSRPVAPCGGVPYCTPTTISVPPPSSA